MPPRRKADTVPALAAMAADLRAKMTAARIADLGPLTFKKFLLSEDFGAPFLRSTTPAGQPLLTPVAEAIVDAIDGTPITTIDDTVCRRIFGCTVSEFNALSFDRLMYILSGGGRSGKTTRFLVCAAAWKAWTVPLAGKLAPGQEAYAAISAPTEYLSIRAKQMAADLVLSSPAMRAAVVGSAVEKTLIKRPDGGVVALIVAVKGELAGRAGSYVFFGVDEGEYFPQDGSPNDLEKMVSGARQRMLPGAIIAVVSTPRVEGEGFMQRTIAQNRGRHRTALAIEQVWTAELHPHWDPDGKKEAAEREASGDVDADCEYKAIPKPRGVSRFVDQTWLDVSKDVVIGHDDPIVQIGAGSDLGMVQDGSDLWIIARHASGRFSLRGSAHARPTHGPLVPSVVCSEFAMVARLAGATSVAADIHYAGTYQEHLNSSGLALIPCPTGREKYGVYKAMQQILATARLSTRTGMSPRERDDLFDQLTRIVEIRNASGVRVELPRRVIRSEADAAAAKKDHCDGAAALAVALWAAGAGAGLPVVVTEEDDTPVELPYEPAALALGAGALDDYGGAGDVGGYAYG